MLDMLVGTVSSDVGEGGVAATPITVPTGDSCSVTAAASVGKLTDGDS